ncbi:MAG: VOC family protein [Pseudomonadota bacterium]
MNTPTPAISMVTLGVDDLEAATRFYQALGWHKAPQSQDTVTFLQGHNIILGLYGREALAEDANVEYQPAGFSAVTLARNLPSPEDVDAFFELAIKNGATALKQPQKVFWGGYSGYFTDIDGHFWEIAHNPFFNMDDHGQIDLLKDGGE